VTSPDEITRTAGRLRDALGAAADVMTVGDRPVRARRPVIGSAWKWLLPSAAAATAAAIVLAEVLAGHPAGDALAGGPFTRVFSSDGDVNVAAPDPAVLNGPGQLAAEGSVVKIQGSAPECGRQSAGSGFVYAPQHVLTVAHVLAGTQGQIVTTNDGVTYRARVVFYDPRTDIAVLDVPGLNLAPLTFNAHGQPGDNAVVAGYTQGHSFTAAPARIGRVLRVGGPDIYGSGQVDRQIYQIRGDVRLGNFGGPLLSPAGTVDGVVFARAVGATDIAFVLTASEIQADASVGAHATVPVSTQRCL
jgi:S1-C subfamily serine protease